MNRSEAFAELRKRGIAKVVVSFSGGGDEGGCDDITLFNAEGAKVGTLQEEYIGDRWDATLQKWVPMGDRTADGDLADVLCKPVYDKYYTFAGEFHVNGEVVWDVAKGTVNMQGSESVERYDDFEDEL